LGRILEALRRGQGELVPDLGAINIRDGGDEIRVLGRKIPQNRPHDRIGQGRFTHLLEASPQRLDIAGRIHLLSVILAPIPHHSRSLNL
jgi:hypothetical protein